MTLRGMVLGEWSTRCRENVAVPARARDFELPVRAHAKAAERRLMLYFARQLWLRCEWSAIVCPPRQVTNEERSSELCCAPGHGHIRRLSSRQRQPRLHVATDTVEPREHIRAILSRAVE